MVRVLGLLIVLTAMAACGGSSDDPVGDVGEPGSDGPGASRQVGVATDPAAPGVAEPAEPAEPDTLTESESSTTTTFGETTSTSVSEASIAPDVSSTTTSTTTTSQAPDVSTSP